MENKEIVFNLLKQIPKGKVTTYKELAKKAGIKNPRQVGRIIHTNNQPEIYPCHRVVRSDGTLASGYKFGGREGQKKRLLSEGIKFLGYKINLSRFLFTFRRNTFIHFKTSLFLIGLSFQILPEALSGVRLVLKGSVI